MIHIEMAVQCVSGAHHGKAVARGQLWSAVRLRVHSAHSQMINKQIL